MNNCEPGLIQHVESPAPVVLFSAPMTLEDAKAKHELIRKFCFEVLLEGVDYGVIPGTEKKVLHKPGAEKLCQLFNVHPKFFAVNVVEDFAKPFFFYRYECRLVHNASGVVVGTGIGSCNSYESKYRWRLAKRKCPACGQETIIQGKAEYGGGWLCFRKQGGCGAKFAEAHPDITSQTVGRVENTEIFDQVNTLDKMAQKRALLAPVLILAGVSEYFTQDMDDLVEEVPPAQAVATGTAAPQEAPKPVASPAPAPSTPAAATEAREQQIPAAGSSFVATPYRISLVKKMKELQKFKRKDDTLDQVATFCWGEPMTFTGLNDVEDVEALKRAIARADQAIGGGR